MKNPVARGLRTPRYRVRTVKPKKGKGAYNRGTEKRKLDARVSKVPQEA